MLVASTRIDSAKIKVLSKFNLGKMRVSISMGLLTVMLTRMVRQEFLVVNL